MRHNYTHYMSSTLLYYVGSLSFGLSFSLTWRRDGCDCYWCAPFLFRDEAVYLPKTDAAVERCTSLGFLNSVICYETVEGPVCASVTSFLLCGMAVMWSSSYRTLKGQCLCFECDKHYYTLQYVFAIDKNQLVHHCLNLFSLYRMDVYSSWT